MSEEAEKQQRDEALSAAAETDLEQWRRRVEELETLARDREEELARMRSELQEARSEALRRFRIAVSGGDDLVAALAHGDTFDEVEASARAARAALADRVRRAVEEARRVAAALVPSGGAGRLGSAASEMSPREKIISGLGET